MQKPRVLIVDDEPSIVANVLFALESEGMEHGTAGTLADARIALAEQLFDIMVLDVSLPDGTGFDFCKEVRKTNQIPIIFVTARSEEIDRILGLEIGGDDYVVKPFSPRELTSRIKVILRRTNLPPTDSRLQPPDSEIKENKTFHIDDPRKTIYCRSEALSFSLYEYRILHTLLNAPGRVFSRDQLMDAAWDDPASSVDRAVDTHVKNIRKKLLPFFDGKEIIRTHRGLGYSLAENIR